jgi:hypothetical protein
MNSGKGVVDLMGKMSFSSMVELEKKKERGSFWCVWGGEGEGEGTG